MVYRSNIYHSKVYQKEHWGKNKGFVLEWKID